MAHSAAGRCAGIPGHEVQVLQAFHHKDELCVDGVQFEFFGSAMPHPAAAFTRRLAALQPDVVHVFGVTELVLCLMVGAWCRRNGVVASVSYHGGYPRRRRLGQLLQRRALSGFSTLFFSSTDASEAWRGVVHPRSRVAVMPEVSSPFAGIPRQRARESLGVTGDPVFAWAGRLHEVKDPITALDGFRRVTGQYPQARLLMAYRSTELLPEVRQFLNKHPALTDHVRLLGALPHPEMEVLFSAADYFLQSSRREYGGNALVEAASCGATPAVSDIPSFQALTTRLPGSILFPVGDSEALSRLVARDWATRSQTARDDLQKAFQRYLSYPVLAAAYEAAFSEAMAHGFAV